MTASTMHLATLAYGPPPWIPHGSSRYPTWSHSVQIWSWSGGVDNVLVGRLYRTVKTGEIASRVGQILWAL